MADEMPNKSTSKQGRDLSIALVLGGGNALGAYQAGAYQALHEHGMEFDRVVGASAGAMNGAIICGNPAEDRLVKLEALWRPAPSDAQGPGPFDETRRTMSVVQTLSTGHPMLFLPRNPMSRWWDPYGDKDASSLYDATPLGGTLDGLVDFDRLNAGAPRFGATAVDVESGEDVIFDTARERIGVAHLRASSALLPVFQPVEVDGRLLGDAGISSNLPLDAVMRELPGPPTLCIAIDLLPLRGPRPSGMGETITRMQDLIFATQSRRAIAAWQAIFDERVRRGDAASATVLHIAYSDHAREVSGKAFDFSPESARARWDSGYGDMSAALKQLTAGEIVTGQPGLTVYAGSGSGRGLEQVRWPLGPIHASP